MSAAIRPHLRSAPIFDADIDGNAAIVLIDTGADSNMVSHEFVTAHGLKVQRNPMRTMDAGGNTAHVYGFAKFSDVRFGDAHLRGVDANVKDLSLFHVGTKSADVVFGFPAFKNRLVTFDFPNGRLTASEGSLPEPDGVDVLPLVTDYNQPMVCLRVGNKQVWTLIDTGYSGGMAIPDWLRLSLPGLLRVIEGQTVRYWYGEGKSQLGRLSDSVQIGRHSIFRPLVSVGLGDVPVLGMEYLQHFAITFDQTNKRVRFVRNKTIPIIVPPIRTAGMQLDRTGKVIQVMPNGNADKVGLKVGDQVTMIDGVPYADILKNMPTDLNLRTQIKLTVNQEGNTRDIVVPLTILLP